MAKEKPPAFQFYVKDWIADERVRLMSHTEKGMYIDLLCLCWNEGSLPLETDTLAKLLHLPLPRFTKVWENSPLRQCFYVGEDGRMHHKRLDSEREKQGSYKDGQSANGKKGAEARWGKPADSDGGAMATPSETVMAIDSSASASAFASSSPSPQQQRKPLSAAPKQPVPGFPRLRLFGWMLERFHESLGATDFDLDGWLLSLEQDDRLVIPTDRDERWRWLQQSFDFELRKRGHLRSAPAMGKQTTRLASAIANIMSEKA